MNDQNYKIICDAKMHCFNWIAKSHWILGTHMIFKQSYLKIRSYDVL